MKKLVRDRLGETIPASQLSTCNPRLRVYWLNLKLTEEIEEVRQANFNDPYEFADVIEVLLALAKEKGITPKQISSAIIQKRAAYGRFEQGLIYDKPSDRGPGKDV